MPGNLTPSGTAAKAGSVKLPGNVTLPGTVTLSVYASLSGTVTLSGNVAPLVTVTLSLLHYQPYFDCLLAWRDLRGLPELARCFRGGLEDRDANRN